jgi:hypothetical protein
VNPESALTPDDTSAGAAEATSAIAQKSRRFAHVGALDVAACGIAATAALCFTDAVGIAFRPWPVEGLWMRLLHHLFDALEVVGVGAVPVILAILVQWRRHHRDGGGALAFVAAGLVCTAAMQQLIGPQLLSIPPGLGLPRSALIPLCLVGAGMLVPACVWLALWASRRTWSGIAASAFGLANLVANQIVLPDDYAGEHTAWVWVSAILAGSVLIEWSRDRIRLHLVSRFVAITAACVLGIAWVPSDSLRVVILRPPGSVVSWVLSRWVWTSPPLIVPIPRRSTSPIRSMPPRRKYPDAPVVVLMTVEAFRGDLLDEGRFDGSLPHMAALRDSGAYFPRAIRPALRPP